MAALVKTNSELRSFVLADVDELSEQFQIYDLDPLVACVKEYKRCPKRGRDGHEDKLAQLWKHLLDKLSGLPQKLQNIVRGLELRMSTDSAWIEVEKRMRAPPKAPLIADYEAVRR